MGDPGAGDIEYGGGGGPTEVGAAVLRRRHIEVTREAQSIILRRRRPLTPIATAIAQPTTTSATEQHVLTKDFVTATLGTTVASGQAIAVLRDADNALRLYLEVSAQVLSFFSLTMHNGGFPYYEFDQWNELGKPGVASILGHDGVETYVWLPL